MIKIIMICFICQCLAFDLTFEEFLAATPQKSLIDYFRFGMITPTYNSKKDYRVIIRHINRYAKMDCPPLEEIVIVWNNEDDPAHSGFKQRKEWKRPVHFHKTPHNSMDLRYSLPPESVAKVFFSIDDDVIIECEKLVEGFEKWKEHAVGDIAPLVGYRTISFHFDSQKSRFSINN